MEIDNVINGNYLENEIIDKVNMDLQNYGKTE